METVLILTSGIGSRLGEYTEYTNKSLVRVGDKFSICHIIDKYVLDNTRFVVTIGYKGDLVKEFLRVAYPNKEFEYAVVDKFHGKGSSLGYSLLQARKYLQCPFTLYCCDSIVIDVIPKSGPYNIIYVSKTNDATNYASICTSGEEVACLSDKGETKFDYVYTGVCHIHDYEQYWTALQVRYSADTYNENLGDIQVMSDLLKSGVKFNFSVLDRWFDTGNTRSYKKACEHFRCKYNVLYKKEESICFLENHVIKFFNNSRQNTDRVTRGRAFGNIAPNIIASTEHFFSMELVKGTILSEYYVHGEIYRLLAWAKKNLWVNESISTEHSKTSLKFYKDKTFDRIEKLPSIGKEANVINGIHTGCIKEALDMVDWPSLSTDTFYQFHGDFIMDNIIKTDAGYKLIDWRQDFGGNLHGGDMYYDLAKLRHNIIFNHRNIDSGLFTLDFVDDGVIVDLKCNYFLMNQLGDFDRFVADNNLDLKKIKILTAIIWINMAPLHEKNISKFLFYFGKYNLHLELSSAVVVL